jgi:hypothetical protein
MGPVLAPSTATGAISRRAKLVPPALPRRWPAAGTCPPQFGSDNHPSRHRTPRRSALVRSAPGCHHPAAGQPGPRIGGQHSRPRRVKVTMQMLRVSTRPLPGTSRPSPDTEYAAGMKAFETGATNWRKRSARATMPMRTCLSGEAAAASATRTRGARRANCRTGQHDPSAIAGITSVVCC